MLNGVVLVSHFNQLRARGIPEDRIVVEGSMRRLRPVLMTASITAFGLIPLLFASGPRLGNPATAGDRRDWRAPLLDGADLDSVADPLPSLRRHCEGLVVTAAAHVCLTLVAGRELRAELFDYLSEQADIVPGFTASEAAGHGPEVRLHSAAERVKGRADRILVRIIMEEEAAESTYRTPQDTIHRHAPDALDDADCRVRCNRLICLLNGPPVAPHAARSILRGSWAWGSHRFRDLGFKLMTFIFCSLQPCPP